MRHHKQKTTFNTEQKYLFIFFSDGEERSRPADNILYDIYSHMYVDENGNTEIYTVLLVPWASG